MSANVNFAVAPPTSAAARAKGGPQAGKAGAAAAAAAAPVVILPYDILHNLQGRRVTVMLSVGGEEMEGFLRTVDDDRGDLFLEDVVHYVWEADAGSSGAGKSARKGAEAATGAMRPCVTGGGARRVVGRSDAVMVNSRFMDLITPTVFGGADEAGTA